MGNILQASYIDVHEAARAGHIDEVRRWVDEGKPVDVRDNTQKTPLHHAAQWGQEEALDFLIECGANVNASDFIEDTPLHLACYFGHAICARILIMVGADIGAKDCYGNTPSQIFDDHVTEPVLDEIRFIIREVIKGPSILPEPDGIEAAASSATNENTLDDDRLRVERIAVASTDLSALKKEACSGRLSSDDGVLRPDFSDAEERPTSAARISRHPPAQNKETLTFQGASAAALEPAKRCPPSVVGGPPILAAEEGLSYRRRILALGDEKESSGWVVGTSGQHPPRLQQTAGAERGVARRRSRTMSGDHGNVDAFDAGDSEKGCPPEVSISNENGLQGSGTLAPPLALRLPWENQIGPETAKEPSREGKTENSPVASARTLGATGTAVAGLTYPGPRPLSAPSVRTSISAARLNSTSPILSGRRFEGTSALKGRDCGSTRDGSRSSGRTARASLAGTLMSYATRPGGTFDVFAAARDGQVSVLKQALTEGEKVDVQDENGLTPLMWAARAGRLSTAKYLVSQGASLVRRDDATGFSPLHFAAYYCRSSVVRVLVLAGADKTASDNRGKVPGECFQPMSYLSYKAFHHRRLIARFLAGDMNDGMLDKGKTMFPMNSPLEAYDEEHRPQCVRLGSSEKIAAHSDQGSTDRRGRTSEGESQAPGARSSSRSRAHPRPGTSYRRASYRRASADAARKAYATMHTMASTVDDAPAVRKRALTGAESSGGRQSSGVRYYLRRGSIHQVAAMTKEIFGGNNASRQESGSDSGRSCIRSGSSKSRSSSHSRRISSKGGAESGMKLYLRRASLRGVPFIENFLSGGDGFDERNAAATSATAAVEMDVGGKAGDRRQASNEADCDSVPTAATADNLIATAVTAEAVAGAAIAAAAAEPQSVDGRSKDGDTEAGDRSILDNIEGGKGNAGSHGSGKDNSGNIVGEDPSGQSEENAGETGEGGGRGGGHGARRLSAKMLEMMQNSVAYLPAQRQGDRAPRDDRSADDDLSDVESGKRTVPSPSGSNGKSISSATSLASEQQDVSQSQPQSKRQRRSRNHHRHKKTRCDGLDSNGFQKAKNCADAPFCREDGSQRSSGERPESGRRSRVEREDVSGVMVAAPVGTPLAAEPDRPSTARQEGSQGLSISRRDHGDDRDSHGGLILQPFPKSAETNLSSGDPAYVAGTKGEAARLRASSGEGTSSGPVADGARSGEEAALMEEGHRTQELGAGKGRADPHGVAHPSTQQHQDLAGRPLPLPADGSPEQRPERESSAPAPTSAFPPSAAGAPFIPPEQPGKIGVTASLPTWEGEIGNRANITQERNPSPVLDAHEVDRVVCQGDEETVAEVTATSYGTPRNTPAAATAFAAGSIEHRPEALTSGEGVLRRPGGDASAEVFNTFASPLLSPEGQQKEEGGGSRAASPDPTVGSDDESSKKEGRRDRSEGRSRGRKHRHRKHKHQHRHRDRSGDETGGSGGGGGNGGGGDRKNRRRRSKDHEIVSGSPSGSTATMLAPLKRVPPPASAAAQRLPPEGGGPLVGPGLEGGGEGVEGG